MVSPRVKFSKLAQKEKMEVANQLLHFMIFVETRDYGTVDFYWGTKRIKTPEEYQFGIMIGERTAVFTIGALFFNVFGECPKETITKTIENCQQITKR